MQRLIDRYRGLVCDLDGVVYRGALAVSHAVEVLEALEQPVVYATNNASRTPADVVEHLRSLGLSVSGEDVATSSTAAATVLARTLPAGTAVLAVGGEGVRVALAAVGLAPVAPGEFREGRPVRAVVQGYGPEVTAADLGEAAYAVQGGARWVATNVDATLPTDRGQAPGNGSLVGAVRNAVDVDPEVMGKPHPPMYVIAAEHLGLAPAEVLAVGDRLETDIAGAVAAGTGGALVLTGVHDWVDAAAAPRARRPDHVIADLRGLLEPYPDHRDDGGWSVRGAAAARVGDEGVEIRGDGQDVLRAALDALWAAADEGGVDPAWCRGEIARLAERLR
ncbi:HAD-IIA family hydrolase [Janibacter sp. YIM B02568]|uniref:HAD-IIA family hydrolase n=1 Tax=Janibacter endophyticus TaxID=2806261 RepID=UPI00194DAF6A|nr:HAD-IIA family hydrolase [Janibacter endophyticus]MBM6546579.1 HAD-IIA family hydrolase [Janibacter endophyticus]